MLYTENHRMAELMCSDAQVLSIIQPFNIPLGVGEHTIKEICEQHGIDTYTFLAVVNYSIGEEKDIDKAAIHLPTLLKYLRSAHTYFFDFALPILRRKLIEAINYSNTDAKIPMLIIRFFDEYVNEINIHMLHENEQVLPYVESLLDGQRTTEYTSDSFAHQHRAVDDPHIANKLTELKNLIVKYYPEDEDNQLLMSALSDIFAVEKSLAYHCAIEDDILLPAVQLLEKRPKKKLIQGQTTEELSDREKDVLVEVANGLSNKEIADKLFISIHTVISHRKNISRKLNIHSTSGLTIYAIVNNLVDINNVDINSLT